MLTPLLTSHEPQQEPLLAKCHCKGYSPMEKLVMARDVTDIKELSNSSFNQEGQEERNIYFLWIISPGPPHSAGTRQSHPRSHRTITGEKKTLEPFPMNYTFKVLWHIWYLLISTQTLYENYLHKSSSITTVSYKF